MSREKPKMNNRMSRCVSILRAPGRNRPDAKGRNGIAAAQQANCRAMRHGAPEPLPRIRSSKDGNGRRVAAPG
jgi:hypothetical protein